MSRQRWSENDRGILYMINHIIKDIMAKHLVSIKKLQHLGTVILNLFWENEECWGANGCQFKSWTHLQKVLFLFWVILGAFSFKAPKYVKKGTTKLLTKNLCRSFKKRRILLYAEFKSTEKNPKHSPKKSYKPILGSILKVERVDRKFSENSTQASRVNFFYRF
jgi:hypothetical protein